MSTLQTSVCPGITQELVKKQAPIPQGWVGPENLPFQRAPRCCIHPCAPRCSSDVQRLVRGGYSVNSNYCH